MGWAVPRVVRSALSLIADAGTHELWSLPALRFLVAFKEPAVVCRARGRFLKALKHMATLQEIACMRHWLGPGASSGRLCRAHPGAQDVFPRRIVTALSPCAG